MNNSRDVVYEVWHCLPVYELAKVALIGAEGRFRRHRNQIIGVIGRSDGMYQSMRGRVSVSSRVDQSGQSSSKADGPMEQQ